MHMHMHIGSVVSVGAPNRVRVLAAHPPSRLSPGLVGLGSSDDREAATPRVPESANEGPQREIDAAICLLQSLLRGRAAQNEMFLGKQV